MTDELVKAADGVITMGCGDPCPIYPGKLGITRVYCGGDLVGYGPHPNEVCALIQEREIPTIHGNYDYVIARDLEDCGCAYITPHDREIGQQWVDCTLARTGQASKEFMRELPSTCASRSRPRDSSRARLAAQGEGVRFPV
jgi:hypothetical protein